MAFMRAANLALASSSFLGVLGVLSLLALMRSDLTLTRHEVPADSELAAELSEG